MSNIDLKELEQLLKEHNISIESIEKLYPKLYEKAMNLSVTGVPARVYFYWKKSGLIVDTTESTTEKGWLKINLIEYLWIKIIVILREYGVPFEKIKEMKVLMFTNIVDKLSNEKDEYIAFLREKSKYSEAKIQSIDKALSIARSSMNGSPEEFKIYFCLLGNLVLSLLLKNDKGYITISKKGKDYQVGFFSIKTMYEFEDSVKPLLDNPGLFIPIRSIIQEFLEDSKMEKIIETISLLNLKEMKVIDAIRNKDFKEIIIKQDGNKDSIVIEIEKDGNILDQKAKEIKRILGLNEYSEVTIKYRNDKNLYFKNKTRI